MTTGQDLPLNVDLRGQVAIVTGSTSGIGQATALAMASCGAKVIITGRRGHLVESTVQAIWSAGGQAHGVTGDMGQTETIDRLFEETMRVFGPVKILVNNAAYVDTDGHPFDFDDARVDDILNVNLRAPLLCSLRAGKIMAENGGGVIVSLTSVGASQRAHHHNPIYDTCKGGIDGMTRALATDLGPYGIRVNAVGPAATREGEPAEGRGLDLPLRRGGTPEDQACAILFLCSDAARFISGQILYVDGGLMAQLRSPAGSPSSQ